MNAIDLRSVLADPDHAGAYFVADSDIAAIAEAGAALGFQVVSIDLAGCADTATLFARFAQALRFPEWFGQNWDALGDSLGDLSWLPATGYLLLIEHAGGWLAQAPADAETLLAVLDEAASAWAAVEVPFWALLSLPAAQFDAIAP